MKSACLGFRFSTDEVVPSHGIVAYVIRKASTVLHPSIEMLYVFILHPRQYPESSLMRRNTFARESFVHEDAGREQTSKWKKRRWRFEFVVNDDASE